MIIAPDPHSYQAPPCLQPHGIKIFFKATTKTKQKSIENEKQQQPTITKQKQKPTTTTKNPEEIEQPMNK